MAKVLIACETSGVVREAFERLGHDAWSCDILPADTPTNRHIQGDVRQVMMENWDLMAVMHPPCTRLCNSGARWLIKPPVNPPADCTPEEAAMWPLMSEAEQLKMIWQHLQAGAELFSDVWNVPHIPFIAVENPVMHKHAKARIKGYKAFSQSFHPWHFGHDEQGPDNVKKRTCVWLRGLPTLDHTGTLDGSTARADVHTATPGKERWKIRSKFYPGIANAMAEKWGNYAEENKAA